MPLALIVSADALTASRLAEEIRVGGWDVMLASDGAAALRLAQRRAPDALVLSGQLPGGGAAAIRRLRFSPHTAAVPVLVVGGGRATDEVQVRAAGAQAVLPADASGDAIRAAIADQVATFHSPTTAPGEILQDPGRVSMIAAIRPMTARQHEVIDMMTQLAARLLDVPMSIVTLVETDRQVFVSQVGIAQPWAARGGTPLSHSFCQWVVSGNESLVVDDARLHPLLRINLAVDELGVVAYAGVPLGADAGSAGGSFCAIDSKPRQWSEGDLLILGELASITRPYLFLPERGGAQGWPRGTADSSSQAIRAATQLLRREAERLLPAEADLLVRIIGEQTQQLGHMAGNA